LTRPNSALKERLRDAKTTLSATRRGQENTRRRTSDTDQLLWLKRRWAIRLLVLLGLGTLDLGGAGEGLLTVLALLACEECCVRAGVLRKM
jgi:hypothetical protein